MISGWKNLRQCRVSAAVLTTYIGLLHIFICQKSITLFIDVETLLFII